MEQSGKGKELALETVGKVCGRDLQEAGNSGLGAFTGEKSAKMRTVAPRISLSAGLEPAGKPGL